MNKDALVWEILQSKRKAEHLTEQFSPPKDNWEKENIRFFKIQIVLEDLLYRKVISRRMERKIQRSIQPQLFKHILAESRLEENPHLTSLVKEGLAKKWVRDNLVKYKKVLS